MIASPQKLPLLDLPHALARYLERRGFPIDARETVISCPFHEDERPSCRVELALGVWRCDPCARGGGALDLVEALEGVDRPGAMKILSDALGASEPPARGIATPPALPERPADFAAILAKHRERLDRPDACHALDWLSSTWGVSRELLDLYAGGLGWPARLETPVGKVETFQLACPSSLDGHTVSGIKLHRPRCKELNGEPSAKCISERGSRPGLFGYPLLARASGRVALLVGGEKDSLVAAAALPELVVVAHAGGEGTWTSTRGKAGESVLAIAKLVADSKPSRVVVALDANEGERGTPAAIRALLAAGCADVRPVAWPVAFAEAWPKGGAKDFLLDPRFGPAAFRELVQRASLAYSLPPGAPAMDTTPKAKKANSSPANEPTVPAKKNAVAPSAPRVRAGVGAERLPRVAVGPDLGRVADEALAALAASECAPYVMGGALVRVGRLETGAHRIDPLPLASLTEALSRVAIFVGKNKQGQTARRQPPREVVAALHARGSWEPLRPLRGIATCPFLRRDGSIAAREGYDTLSSVYLALGGVNFPEVPARPSREHALAALDALREVFADFPFASPSSRSTALALVLTLLALEALPGPAPVFLSDATDRGAGKTLLAVAAGALAAGAEPPLYPPCEDDVEESKRLLAAGLEGQRVLIVDNVERGFGSATLALAATSPARTFTARLLGHSRNVTVRVPVIVATGNAVALRGDLGRRVLPIYLDPKCERPDTRSGFRHPALLEWVKAERPRLVAAGLSILRWSFVEQPRVTLTPFGSFEGWSGLVRAALVGLGEADPCEGRERVREDADAALAELRAALAAWREAFGAEELTTAEAIEGASDALRETLAALARVEAAKLDGRRLGYALRAVRGRVVGGLRFESPRKDRNSAALWRVVALDSSSPVSPAHHQQHHPQANRAADNALPESAGDAGDVPSLRARARVDEGRDADHHPHRPHHPHRDSLGWLDRDDELLANRGDELDSPNPWNASSAGGAP